MHLRYNLRQMINLYSLTGCVRIKGCVCTDQLARRIAACNLKMTYHKELSEVIVEDDDIVEADEGPDPIDINGEDIMPYHLFVLRYEQ